MAGTYKGNADSLGHVAVELYSIADDLDELRDAGLEREIVYNSAKILERISADLLERSLQSYPLTPRAPRPLCPAEWLDALRRETLEHLLRPEPLRYAPSARQDNRCRHCGVLHEHDSACQMGDVRAWLGSP